LGTVGFLGVNSPVVKEAPKARHFCNYRPSSDDILHASFPSIGALTLAASRGSVLELCPLLPRLRGSPFDRVSTGSEWRGGPTRPRGSALALSSGSLDQGRVGALVSAGSFAWSQN